MIVLTIPIFYLFNKYILFCFKISFIFIFIVKNNIVLLKGFVREFLDVK